MSLLICLIWALGVTCIISVLSIITFCCISACMDKVFLWTGIFAVIRLNPELFTKANRAKAIKMLKAGAKEQHERDHIHQV